MGQSPDAEIIFGFEYPLSEYDEKTYEYIARYPGDNDEDGDLDNYLEDFSYGEQADKSPVDFKTAGSYEGERWYIIGLKGTYQNAYGWQVEPLELQSWMLDGHELALTAEEAVKWLREEVKLKRIPEASEWKWLLWATYG